MRGPGRRGLETPLAPVPLFLGPNAQWFRMANGERRDLRRRRSLRAIVWGLAQRHRDDPGSALSLIELLAIGWPGERMLPRAGAAVTHLSAGAGCLRANGEFAPLAIRETFEAIALGGVFELGIVAMRVVRDGDHARGP